MRIINELVGMSIKGWFDKGRWPLAIGYWHRYPKFATPPHKISLGKCISKAFLVVYTNLPTANTQQPIALVGNRPLTSNTIHL